MNWRWRRFKERINSFFHVCWFKGGHNATMLEDDVTIYCERCGKVLGEIKRTIKTDKSGQRFLEGRYEPIDKALVKAKATIKRERLQAISSERAELSKEEIARKTWLPEPIQKRRITTRTYQPPAERHRAAISKAMKGKGRMSRDYRRTIKQSPKVPIEEEED